VATAGEIDWHRNIFLCREEALRYSEMSVQTENTTPTEPCDSCKIEQDIAD
jgi:hypothetical protein